MRYLTVNAFCRNETVINRSRFICSIYPVEDEIDAQNKLKAVKKEFSDATHNVYCYVSKSDGSGVRFSDDGEPQGTSAQPMLEVLLKREIVKVLCVVTRYFGGVKLGAAGLVGAYSDAVAKCLDKADIVSYVQSSVLGAVTDYGNFSMVKRTLDESGAKILSSAFENEVTIEFAVPEEDEQDLRKKLENLTRGSIRLSNIKKDFILS